MWTVIIFAVIGFFLVIFPSIRDLDEFVSDLGHALIGAVVGAIIGCVVAVCLPCKYENVKKTYLLEALQDNNSISTSYICRIDGSMKYVFYYEKDGYFIMQQAHFNEVKVKYCDKNPFVEVFYKKEADAFINRFSFDISCCNKTYIIHVPKGTIRRSYYLDAM